MKLSIQNVGETDKHFWARVDVVNWLDGWTVSAENDVNMDWDSDRAIQDRAG
jgi:hypothetical protein